MNSSFPTNRFRLTLHYDGRDFFGWQIQPKHRTVQGELEQVLTRLFDRPARVVAAGRTDRGVHATGQVVALDAPPRWTAPALLRSINALLPGDVWVAAAAAAPAGFHPRFDATSRSYVYKVGLVAEAQSPFHRFWCWPLDEPLDRTALARATAALLGEHSFFAFAKAGQEHRGDRCTVSAARWAEWTSFGIQFEITADRFLHHMVRYLVGTTIEIARGRRPADDLVRLLRGDSSLCTSPPAPPHGLFLSDVGYPDDSISPPRQVVKTGDHR